MPLKGPGYAHKPGFQALYREITTESLEANVDELWLYILRRYFRNDDASGEDYSIALQQRPAQDITNAKADLMVRTLNTGEYQSIVFIEDKRRQHEGSTQKWTDALAQLENYVFLTRQVEHIRLRRTTFGIVTVGRYSRFYEIPPTDPVGALDYTGTGGQYYDFKADEGVIDQILMEIKELTG
ncbi:hypothetical protein F4778DRAFT_588791 [Xylariomycetidae sp. FL2044]|nr:hypothetical protein F4778DRAFT_588791 [Xylariomycetidae sp. FL2044]